MKVYCALVHHPVYNKNKRVITTSITTSNIHDISRTAKTYDVKAFYLITPIVDQQLLIETIIRHWKTGYGSSYNPTRGIALESLRISSTLGECIEKIETEEGENPYIAVTCAKAGTDTTSYSELRKEMASGSAPWLILFGTGWGLAGEVMEMADRTLEPICGPGEYNHLSVRAAIAITLDRLLGKNRDQVL
ncbi:RNA methyltransferase [bacterium]|nr:RNA methyltransferase [bacterium]